MSLMMESCHWIKITLIFIIPLCNTCNKTHHLNREVPQIEVEYVKRGAQTHKTKG